MTTTPRIERTPRDAAAHWHAGVALARRHDWPGAADAFDRAARAAPQDALYWLNLAHAQRRAGTPELGWRPSSARWRSSPRTCWRCD